MLGGDAHSVGALKVESSGEAVQVSAALGRLQAEGIHTATSGTALGVVVASEGRGCHQHKAQRDEHNLGVHFASWWLLVNFKWLINWWLFLDSSQLYIVDQVLLMRMSKSCWQLLHSGRDTQLVNRNLIRQFISFLKHMIFRFTFAFYYCTIERWKTQEDRCANHA